MRTPGRPMDRWWRTILGAAAFLALSGLARSSEALPIAHLTLQSEAGDWVGQGQTFDITYGPDPSGLFSVQALVPIAPSGAPGQVSFLLGRITSGADNTFAQLTFGTDQLGIPIQAGSYFDARRPFVAPGHPTLDVGFQNRGCGVVTGSFTVQQLTLSSAAQAATGSPIEAFSGSFEQHCEGGTPALFGTLTYHAFGVPEPCALELLALAAPWAVRRSREARRESQTIR